MEVLVQTIMNYRSWTKTFFPVAALSVAMLLVTLPADSNPANNRIIDVRGSRIASIYHGQLPNSRFAKQLNLVARQIPQPANCSDSRAEILESRDQRAFPLRLVALRTASPAPIGGCGQYMQPQTNECSESCAPGESYQIFFSTGNEPCNGYDFLGRACNRCQVAESGCPSC